MNPYFALIAMLAKITSKNQLTLPKSVTQAVGPAEYFDVQTRDGQIVLTPVRIQRGDAVTWARASSSPKAPAKAAAKPRAKVQRRA